MDWTSLSVCVAPPQESPSTRESHLCLFETLLPKQRFYSKQGERHSFPEVLLPQAKNHIGT